MVKENTIATLEKKGLIKAIEVVSKFVENVSHDVTRVMEGLQAAAIKYSDPVKLKELVYSIGYLLIAFIVGYYMYQLFQYAHPRIFGMSHIEDLGKIDNEIRESMAKALTSYYIGVPIPNYLKQKGPYPNIYTASPEVLQTIVKGVSARLNFHKTSSTYKELLSLAALGGLSANPAQAHSRKVVHEFFYTAMGTAKHPIRSFAKAHVATFKADLELLNSISLFNFIDYQPYEHRMPEKDKTLIRYGSLATPGEKTLTEIFDGSILSSKVEPLLSVNAESIKVSLTNKNERLKSLLAYLRSAKYDVFTGAGINEGDYLSDIKEHEQQIGGNTNPHPRIILSLAIHTMETTLDMIDGMLVDGVSQKDLDLIESDIYYKYEAFLHIQHDNGNGPVPVLTAKLIKAYMYAYGEVIALLQYSFYKQTIDDSIFLMIYWYFGCPQNFIKNMQYLSEFYLSFNELSLYKKYDDHITEYRDWRSVNKETVDTMFMENLFTPNFNLYIEGNIYRGVLLNWLDWAATFNETECYWEYFKTMLSNPGTFLGNDFDNGSHPKKCGTNDKHVKEPANNNKSTGIKFNTSNANDDEFFKNKSPKNIEGFKGTNKSVSGDTSPPPVKEGFFGVLGDIASGLAALPGLATNAIRLCVDLVSNVIPMGMKLMQGVINMVVTLIVDVLPKIISLLGVIMKYVNNPLKFLTMVAGFAMYIIATVILLVLKLPFGYELGHLVLVLVVKIGMYFVGAAIAAYNAAIFAMIVTIGLVLVILDGIYFDGVLTRTFYSWFMACETSPFQWHENSNYQTGNKYERKAGVCARPCPEGFEPGMGGFMCVRTPDYIPKQCPQSAINRIYKDKSITTPYVLSNSIPHIDWGSMTRSKKMKITEDIHDAKKDYHTTCAINMKKYNNNALNVCRNIDAVAGNTKDKAALTDICAQTYCQNGHSEPWCYKLRSTNATKTEGIDKYNIIVQMVLYTTIITVFIAIMYILHRGKLLQS
jgi:hypothetical protein